MKQERKELIAGTITFALFITFFMYIFAGSAEGGKGERDRDSYTIGVSFKNTDGIGVGSAVRIAGITVGQVQEVTLTDKFGALVKISLMRTILLPEDSSIAVQSDGLFGSKYLEITPGAEDDDIPLEGGHISYSQDSMRLADILEQVVGFAKQKMRQCSKCMAEAEDEER